MPGNLISPKIALRMEDLDRIWVHPIHPTPSTPMLPWTWAENWWGTVPLIWVGELGLHLTQCRLGRDLPPYQVAVTLC